MKNFAKNAYFALVAVSASAAVLAYSTADASARWISYGYTGNFYF